MSWSDSKRARIALTLDNNALRLALMKARGIAAGERVMHEHLQDELGLALATIARQDAKLDALHDTLEDWRARPLGTTLPGCHRASIELFREIDAISKGES